MSTSEPLLTLEPLIDAVQNGVSGAGWELSGFQKTTSHQFEGRWEGESSRSAYLFFHSERAPDSVSVDVFLDETSQGLKGNLALVVEGPTLAGLGPMKDVMATLSRISAECLPAGYRTPLTVRLRLAGPDEAPEEAKSEVRLKIRIPAKAMRSGADAVSDLASAAVAAFERTLAHEDFHFIQDGDG